MSSFARTRILIASFHTVVAVGRWKHGSRPSCFISPTTHYLVVVASEVDPRTIQVWFSGFRIGTRVHNSPFPLNSILLVSSFLFDAVSNSMLLQSHLVNEEGFCFQACLFLALYCHYFIFLLFLSQKFPQSKILGISLQSL